MRAVIALLGALAGCDRAPPTDAAIAPGNRIEASAIAAGMIADPVRAPLVGSWARENDRMCVLGRTGGNVVGVALDYGEGQACVARGTFKRHGDRLDMTFGDCRVSAQFEGDRIVLPAVVPTGCDRLCTGRASLAALTVERQSGSAADAEAMVAPDGVALCRD